MADIWDLFGDTEKKSNSSVTVKLPPARPVDRSKPLPEKSQTVWKMFDAEGKPSSQPTVTDNKPVDADMGVLERLGRQAVAGLGESVAFIGDELIFSPIPGMHTIVRPMTGDPFGEAWQTAIEGGNLDPAPRNKGEAYAQSVARNIGRAAIPVGGIATTPARFAAETVAAGAGAGVAGEGASDIWKMFGGSEEGAANARALGELTGGLAGGLGPAIVSANRLKRGASHPQYQNIIDTILDLEGGGTLDNPKVSPKGARGPMQVMPDTARKPGFGIRPWDGRTEADRARVGREYAAALMNKYNGDEAKVLAAYNAGHGRVDKLVKKYGDNWWEHLPKETREYLANGLNKMDRVVRSRGVPPIAPEEMARIMNDPEAAGLMPDERVIDGRLTVSETPKVVDDELLLERPKEGLEADNVVDFQQARENRDADKARDFLDEKIMSAADIEQRVLDLDYDPVVMTPASATEQRKIAEQLHNMLPEDHAYRPRTEELVEIWRSIEDNVHQQARNATPEKPDVRGYQPDTKAGARKEPSNDMSAADAADRAGVYGQFTDPDQKAQIDKALADIEADQARRGVPPRQPPEEPPFGGGGGGGGEPPFEGPKYAGSINLERIDISNRAKAHIVEASAPMSMDIQTFRELRGQAHAYIDKHGVEGVLNKETLKRKDVPAHDLAIRGIHAALEEKFQKLNDLFLDPNTSTPAVHLEWVKTRDLLAKAFHQNQLGGKMSGRGLGARRIEVGGGDDNLGQMIDDLTKQRISDEELARLIKENPGAAGKIARDALRPGANEIIFTTWYAMLLSSLPTLSRNIFSNTLMQALENFVVMPIAAATNKNISFREVLARQAGMFNGIAQAFKNIPVSDVPLSVQGKRANAPGHPLVKDLTEGLLSETALKKGKFNRIAEAYRLGRPLDLVERTQSYWIPKNKGVGRVVSAPLRTIAAMDEFFRGTAALADYFGMAHRLALKSGDENYGARVRELLDNPTKEMWNSMREQGQTLRFQDKMELTGLESMTRARPKDAAIIKVMKGFGRVLIPFPRNADRMFFAMLRYSPAGVIEPKNIRDFKKGGARRGEAIARVITGWGLTGALYTWAASGNVTGSGPSDPHKKAQWLKNHQPYSFRVPGGPWISFQNAADPFGLHLMAIADAVEKSTSESDDSFQRKVWSSVKAIGGGISEATYARGVSDFFQAMDDPSGKMFEAWAGRMASSFTTPAMVRNITQNYIDPTVRNPRGEEPLETVGNSVMTGIPGLSDNLPARHDVYGDEIIRENPGNMNIASPFRVRTPGDEITQELDKLVGDKSLVTRAPGKIKDRKLTTEEREAYQELSGRYFTESMRMVMYGGGWSYLPEEQRRKKVKEALEKARKKARRDLGFETGTPSGGGDLWSMF